MLMQAPTEGLIKEWKEIFNQYKDKIQPNKKAGSDIIRYLQKEYSVTEIQNDKLRDTIEYNIKDNEFWKNKLKEEKTEIRTFQINNVGKGKALYDKQDDIFKGITIIVGIELKTSFIFVEGSSCLYDELTAYAGLDQEDITNYFLVAQYIKCKEKFQGKKEDRNDIKRKP